MGEGTRAWNGKDWLEIESKCREQHILYVWVILEGYIKYKQRHNENGKSKSDFDFGQMLCLGL